MYKMADGVMAVGFEAGEMKTLTCDIQTPTAQCQSWTLPQPDNQQTQKARRVEGHTAIKFVSTVVT